MSSPYPQLERCIDVIRRLRQPETGCPWDLEQTHRSLLKYLLEESYEFIEAVQSGDAKMMEEELGDVLLQVLLHSTIAEQEGSFSLESVAKTLADKIVRRHPHVFTGGQKGLTPDQVTENWQKIKGEEKTQKKYSIEHKLLHAPALETALRIGEKSTKLNFDWEDPYQVMMKVEEEWQEVKEELPPGGRWNHERVKEELGDLLFSVAQLSRHLGINPEECLRDANKKFIDRFQKVEDRVVARGGKLETTPQADLEKLWSEVKRQ